jgi:hypothetical protein
MRVAGGIAAALVYGFLALVLAIGAGGPCEDGTAEDFKTVVCDPRTGFLDQLQVVLYVAGPLLPLVAGVAAAHRKRSWILTAGCVLGLVALVGAVFVGTRPQ